ncbi:uncharacterized protein KY384_002622 [Bacidia gigantensis]|uniref:uncharacterized protein n=1 Tax=Bacidia gigantensis TaxID=2732470 RepID=UPI001D0392A8|nr:uncharacterized protein KY384_002622 [Bacidia gigantensis]KAG8532744.1 hypothetical protein KY384_002622 [Bacidia gigantensis]
MCASKVMVTRGYDKRAAAVVLLKHVKNPIKLAREMLVREQTGRDEQNPSLGAHNHVCLGGETAEDLASKWGLELRDKDYFWTKKRWDEHRRGLGKNTDSRCTRNDTSSMRRIGSEGWNGKEYLSQGTTGCVALDKYGTMCVATSTGGLTNKLPFRIGDTPTVGAGFWAEEWNEAPLPLSPKPSATTIPPFVSSLMDGITKSFDACFGHFHGYEPLPANEVQPLDCKSAITSTQSEGHSVAISGTGNGDSFLRLSAARTAGAIVRFSYPALPARTLKSAVNQVVGPGGELQMSAGDRWGKTGEGEGGMIGIELRDGKGEVCWDFNCGGMFRCYGDGKGGVRVGVFRDEEEVRW